MEIIEINESNKEEYNKVVTHPLQSYEWGEFRKKTGVKVIRRGLLENGKIVDAFTLTIHKIPKTPFSIGYLPKGNTPSKEILSELKKIGRENKCIFIQLEPNVKRGVTRSGGPPASARSEASTSDGGMEWQYPERLGLRPAAHPLFTKFTFVLDLDKSEDELLKSFHPKTRYNIRVAEKHGVKVKEDNSDEAFKEYLKLTKETTTRQKFYAHTESYHKKMWGTLGQKSELTAHLLTATYTPNDEPQTVNRQPIALVSWILFVFQDTLYYPYGASSSRFRNVMASNLIMWEAILFGKKLGLKYFDMWGALGKNPDSKDPWYGFHKFKEGYGAVHTEFVGSFDLVINPLLYQGYKVADKLRWTLLRIKKL